jgi:hypothetical protein
MRSYVTVTATAGLLGLATLAQAAQLLGPPLPTGTRNTGVCRVLNTGTTPVNLEVALISNNDLGVGVENSCNGAPLPGGRTCLVLANLPDSSYVTCSVTAPSVSKLRGTLEVGKQDNYKVLVAEDLR